MKNKDLKKLKGIIIIILFLLITLVLGKCIINIVNQKESFKLLVKDTGFFGYLFYVLICAIQVIFAFIPSEAIEITGGYVFGPFISALLCLIGIVIGSSTVIMLTQKYGKKFVNLFHSNKDLKEVKFLKDNKKVKPLIFLIFLIPGTPKDIVTYFVGFTNVSVKDYILLTSFARFPSIVISTLAGSYLYESEYNKALIFLIISILTGLIGLLIYQKIIRKKKNI